MLPSVRFGAPRDPLSNIYQACFDLLTSHASLATPSSAFYDAIMYKLKGNEDATGVPTYTLIFHALYSLEVCIRSPPKPRERVMAPVTKAIDLETVFQGAIACACPLASGMRITDKMVVFNAGADHSVIEQRKIDILEALDHGLSIDPSVLKIYRDKALREHSEL